jgi:hypothetical protein
MAFSLTKKRHSHSKTWLYVLGFIALFIIILRMIIPSLIVTLANRRGASESPYFAFHINDIDLHILKGQYVVEGITGKIKSNGENFLSVASVTTSVPWKNIFKGLVVADVLVDKGHIAASQVLLDQAKLEGERLKKEYPPKEEREPKEDSKVRLRTFKLVRSDVLIHDFMSFKGKETRSVTDINVAAENLIPTKGQPDTPFKVTANVFGPAPLLVTGVGKLLDKPISWDANVELKNFDLPSVNPFIMERVGAYIKSGKLDNYVEVTSKGGVIQGYEKPFVSKLKMDTPKGGFKFTGAAAATGGNLVKVLLTDSEAKTLASKVPFTFEKKLEVAVLPALTKAVEHKAKQNIKPGIEDEHSLIKGKIIQAQEAKP